MRTVRARHRRLGASPKAERRCSAALDLGAAAGLDRAGTGILLERAQVAAAAAVAVAVAG